MSQAANKTAQVLQAWADVAAGACLVGTALDVGGKFKIGVAIRMGRKSNTAFTSGSPNIRIEGSVKASGNNAWVPVGVMQPLIGATLAQTTLSAGITAGAATFTVASVTNIAAGDILFLGDSSTTNYELVRVKSIASLTITPEENVVNNHANGAVVCDQSEMQLVTLDVEGLQRVRSVVDNIGSGRDIAVEVLATTLDSVG